MIRWPWTHQTCEQCGVHFDLPDDPFVRKYFPNACATCRAPALKVALRQERVRSWAATNWLLLEGFMDRRAERNLRKQREREAHNFNASMQAAMQSRYAQQQNAAQYANSLNEPYQPWGWPK